MANPNAPQGLKPMRMLAGSPYSGAGNLYHVAAGDATALFVGGLVKLTGDADVNGVPTVTGNVASGDAVVGVVMGVKPLTQDSPTYRPASVEQYVMVADDPNIVFEIQEDSVGGAGTSANVGNVANLAGITSGSTVTGLSGMQMDTSTATAAGDGTQDLLVLGLVQRQDNVFGDYAKWKVRLNNHAFVDGNTGA